MTDKLTRTIKAISVKKKAEGEIGFLTIEEEKWYNIKADEKVLDGVLEKTIKKGNKVEFELKNGFAENFKVLEEAKSSGKWEDDMVTFEDLLTKAHGLKVPFSIKTKMLEFDLEKKFALFKARIIIGSTEIGKVKTEEVVFEGHGDATADNVTGEFIKPHFIRMAETRAIVRALRWYTNNGCAEEEK